MKHLASAFLLSCLLLLSGCSFYTEEKTCLENTTICSSEKHINWGITILINAIILMGIVGAISERFASSEREQQKALAENVVDFFQKIEADTQLKEKVVKAENLNTLLQVANDAGYPFTQSQLSFMGTSFSQEVEAMSRLLAVSEITGREKFGEEIEKLESELAQMKSSISLISKFLLVEKDFPQRLIKIPSSLVTDLSTEKIELIKNMGVEIQP